MRHTRVYDQNRVLLGDLPNATPTYTLKDVPLHTAKFTLPIDDPGNELCQMFNLVELYDGDRRVELFRIIEVPEAKYGGEGTTVTYKCEHVFATLIDDVIPGYHEVGGWGGDGHTEFNTRGCLQYVLNFQTTQNWVLDRCDYDRHFQYSWEDEKVLRALLSIPNRLEDEYMFTFNTTVYPWKVSLVQLGQDAQCELRYRRNLREVTKTVDATGVVTRIYPRGYGEGVNTLKITDVNGGQEYLDADTLPMWGMKAFIWKDARFEVAQSLKERALAILEESKNPYISYKVKAAALYNLTSEPLDDVQPGRLVRVVDDEHSLRFIARVTEVTRPDPRGQPGELTVTIANKAKNVAGTISELASRASIQELYADGATNAKPHSFADNADKDHPAVLSVYISREDVRINKAVLRWKLQPFRHYLRGTEAGGGEILTTASGGATISTSSYAGGQQPTSSVAGQETVTSSASSRTTTSQIDLETTYPSVQFVEYAGLGSGIQTGPATGNTSSASGITSEAGGGYTSDVYLSTGTGGGGSTSSASGGSTGGPSTTNTGSVYGGDPGSNHVHSLSGHTHTTPSHSHSAPSHSHDIGIHHHQMTSHYHTTSSHYHSLNSHTHEYDHTHGMPHTHGYGHSHSIDHTHTITIPAHSHTVQVSAHSHSVEIAAHTHSLTIPMHNHELIPGIYNGPSVSAVRITVNGEEVPAALLEGNELDIVAYLSKDDAGKIRRDIWHDVEIWPIPTEHNANGLARIVANLHLQTFVRSQGGGNY